jgi:hypothetical protein
MLMPFYFNFKNLTYFSIENMVTEIPKLEILQFKIVVSKSFNPRFQNDFFCFDLLEIKEHVKDSKS